MWIWVLGVIFLILFLMVIISSQKFKEINRTYGKPYKAKIIQIIGGHPELKGGTASLAFHPRSAISFNKKVFTLAQIKSVKVSNHLQSGENAGTKSTMLEAYPDHGENQQRKYVFLTVVDEHGESQIIFTVEQGFDELSSELFRIWNLLNFV